MSHALAVLFIVTVSSDTIATVDEYLQDIFEVSGMKCNDTQQCYDAYYNNSILSNAYWECTNNTITNIDSDTEIDVISICVFDQCTENIDCKGGELCWTINHCNSFDQFHDEIYGLYSTICLSYDTCSTITYDDENYAASINDTVQFHFITFCAYFICYLAQQIHILTIIYSVLFGI